MPVTGSPASWGERGRGAGLAAAVVVLAAVAGWLLYPCWSSPPTTVLIVRHAEKSTDPPGDPLLSPTGFARATELARVAGVEGIAAIYVTTTNRTRQTAAPLAERLGLTPVELAPRETRQLAARIRAEHRGDTVLVVGHSNTVPDIIAHLGGGAVAPIPETVYDRLFLVVLQPCRWGTTTVVDLRFGESTP